MIRLRYKTWLVVRNLQTSTVYSTWWWQQEIPFTMVMPTVAVSSECYPHSPLFMESPEVPLWHSNGVNSGDGRPVRLSGFTAAGQLGRSRGRLTRDDVSDSCASYTTGDVICFRTHYHTTNRDPLCIDYFCTPPHAEWSFLGPIRL